MKEQRPPRKPPTAAISADRRPMPAKHVSTAVHGTRTVLLDSKVGRYYTLDEVGGRVWSMTNAGHTADQIVDQLAEEYESDRSNIVTDVNRLLGDLRSTKLLEDT